MSEDLIMLIINTWPDKEYRELLAEHRIRELPMPRPTTALPGTKEKVKVMQSRFENRQALFHPRDARA